MWVRSHTRVHLPKDLASHSSIERMGKGGSASKETKKGCPGRQEGNRRACCDRSQVKQGFQEEGVSPCAQAAAGRIRRGLLGSNLANWRMGPHRPSWQEHVRERMGEKEGDMRNIDGSFEECCSQKQIHTFTQRFAYSSEKHVLRPSSLQASALGPLYPEVSSTALDLGNLTK